MSLYTYIQCANLPVENPAYCPFLQGKEEIEIMFDAQQRWQKIQTCTCANTTYFILQHNRLNHFARTGAVYSTDYDCMTGLRLLLKALMYSSFICCQKTVSGLLVQLALELSKQNI